MAKKSEQHSSSRSFSPSKHPAKKGPPSEAPKRGPGRPPKAAEVAKPDPEKKPAFGSVKGASTKPNPKQMIEIEAELLGNLKELSIKSKALKAKIKDQTEKRDAARSERKELGGKRSHKAEELAFDETSAQDAIDSAKAKLKEISNDIDKLVGDIGNGQRFMPKVLGKQTDPDPALDPVGKDDPDDPDQEVMAFGTKGAAGSPLMDQGVQTPARTSLGGNTAPIGKV